MPEIQFSQESILSLGEFSAGWYPMQAKSISEGPGTKDPSSTTWTCEFEVIDGPKKGAQITTWFSSKMPANALNYLKCFVKDPQPGVSYPLDQTVDKPIMGYVVFDMDRNANVIKSFKPIGK